MNHTPQSLAQALIDRQGLKLAAQFRLGEDQLPHDVQERLRAARERAMARRKVEVVRQHAPSWAAHGPVAAITWGGEERMNLWGRLSGALALGALVLGLLGISDQLSDERVRELADVDMALLTDELPPAAFADPGFLQFLKKDL